MTSDNERQPVTESAIDLWLGFAQESEPNSAMTRFILDLCHALRQEREEKRRLRGAVARMTKELREAGKEKEALREAARLVVLDYDATHAVIGDGVEDWGISQEAVMACRAALSPQGGEA